MRILMFSAIFPPVIGGPATQCYNLCKELVKNGVTPIVVTYYKSKNFSVSEENGFKVYKFKSDYTNTKLDKGIRWIVFPFYILYIFKKEKIDVLHCHSVSALSFISAFIGKILGIPSIVKFAGDWVWETLSTSKVQAKDFVEIYEKSYKAKFMFWVQRKGLDLFDKIWVVSEFRKKNIEHIMGNDKKTVFIYNCLILKDGRANTTSPSDPINILSVNRFIPHKRIPFIVQLFSELNLPNSKLTLIGGGDQKEVDAVKEAIEKYKLQDKVVLKGIQNSEQVYEEMKKTSFYISASIEEGLPNVFIEAMNYGLPIIATDEGGSKELVLDQKTGFMFTPKDHEAVLNAMRRLSTDLNLRNEMSKNAFERSKLFNIEIHIKTFIKMYQDLLKK